HSTSSILELPTFSCRVAFLHHKARKNGDNEEIWPHVDDQHFQVTNQNHCNLRKARYSFLPQDDGIRRALHVSLLWQWKQRKEVAKQRKGCWKNANGPLR